MSRRLVEKHSDEPEHAHVMCRATELAQRLVYRLDAALAILPFMATWLPSRNDPALMAAMSHALQDNLKDAKPEAAELRDIATSRLHLFDKSVTMANALVHLNDVNQLLSKNAEVDDIADTILHKALEEDIE